MTTTTNDERLQGAVEVLLKSCGEHEARAREICAKYKDADMLKSFLYFFTTVTSGRGTAMIPASLDTLEQVYNDSCKRTGKPDPLSIRIDLHSGLR